MRMLIATLAVALTLTLLTLGRGAGDVEAAASCRQIYQVCLARCGANSPRCQRCQVRYKYCVVSPPYMGNLL
jgi:hypothetical protein